VSDQRPLPSGDEGEETVSSRRLSGRDLAHKRAPVRQHLLGPFVPVRAAHLGPTAKFLFPEAGDAQPRRYSRQPCHGWSAVGGALVIGG